MAVATHETTISPPVLTKEAMEACAARYDTMRDAVNHSLTHDKYKEVYGAASMVFSEAADYLREVSPGYMAQNNKVANTAIAVENTDDYIRNGYVAGDTDGTYLLEVNRSTRKSEDGVPYIPAGRYADIGQALGFSISLSPEAAKDYGKDIVRSLEGYTDQLPGTETGFVLILAHEFAHALHDEGAIAKMLSERPDWAMSDSLARSVVIEKERFAKGVESAVTARYIARVYGGDQKAIEDVIRHEIAPREDCSAIFNETATGEWSNETYYKYSKDNPGYDFPLTKQQIADRLEAINGISDCGVAAWDGMSKAEGSDWAMTTRDAQLLSGLRKLAKSSKQPRAKLLKDPDFRKTLFAGGLLIGGILAGAGARELHYQRLDDPRPNGATPEVVEPVHGDEPNSGKQSARTENDRKIIWHDKVAASDHDVSSKD